MWRRLAKGICNADFADSIALLSNTLHKAQLKTSAKQIWLHINNSKTEYTKFSQGEGDLKAFTKNIFAQEVLFTMLR